LGPGKPFGLAATARRAVRAGMKEGLSRPVIEAVASLNSVTK
jgi:hypothetical protein